MSDEVVVCGIPRELIDMLKVALEGVDFIVRNAAFSKLLEEIGQATIGERTAYVVLGASEGMSRTSSAIRQIFGQYPHARITLLASNVPDEISHYPVENGIIPPLMSNISLVPGRLLGNSRID